MHQRGPIDVRDDGQHAMGALGGVDRDVEDSPAALVFAPDEWAKPGRLTSIG